MLSHKCLFPLVLLSGLTTFSMGQTPPPPASMPQSVQVPGSLGEWVGGSVALYKVTSYESGMRSYKLKYNQSGTVIHPGFATDRLAVLQLEIKNVTDHPILPPVFQASLTDTEGALTSEWRLDNRQKAFVKAEAQDIRSGPENPAEIAVGQVMKVALIFSVSAKAEPVKLEFSPENYHTMTFGQRRDGSRSFRNELGFGHSSGPSDLLKPAPAKPVPTRMRVSIDLVPKKKS